MANLKNRMRSYLHEMYAAGIGTKRRDDPENAHIHSHSTMQVYCREANRFADWLQQHGVKGRCSDTEAADHIQDYIDWMVNCGRSPSSIHTAVAALCKVFRRKMTDYSKPRRTVAPQKGRAEATSLEGRTDADMTAAEHQRLVEFARRVGIRRHEYKQLCGRDFVTIGSDAYVIVRRGKGGKMQYQRIAPEDAAFVKSYFEGLSLSDRVFSSSELKNKLNLHALRRQHAQALYQQYASRLQEEPGYRAQLTYELRGAFERAGENWRHNPDMHRLDNLYHCRSGVRRSLAASGKPTQYDRLALMAVSVFHLAHWRCDVTVKHYMQ